MFKVNLHLLEACNFRCRTCFAHFDSKRLLSVDEWKRIIDNLYKSGRVNAVNFAGGEPFIYPQLGELVEYAHGLNLKVSIITNGSLITQAWLDRYAHCIDMIGFSIDSFDRNISIAMGRCSCQGQTFGINEFLQIYPQLLKNVRVEDKAAARENEAVKAAVKKVEEALGDDGRILVRESGTEPVIRVMVEASTDELCEKHVNDVIEVMNREGLVVG